MVQRKRKGVSCYRSSGIEASSGNVGKQETTRGVRLRVFGEQGWLSHATLILSSARRRTFVTARRGCLPSSWKTKDHKNMNWYFSLTSDGIEEGSKSSFPKFE